MIFMNFKETVCGTIWLGIEHIASIRACPEQGDRSLVEMDSGSVYEVDGYAEDILKEIVNEYCEK